MKKLINLVIIEDDIDFSILLKELLGELNYINVKGIANTASEAEELFKNPEIDIALMDIELIATTAFDVLNNLPSCNFNVIFITAHEHYALRAIKFSAIDYILKPFNKTELFDAIHKAAQIVPGIHDSVKILLSNINQISSDKIRISLHTQESIVFLNLEEIICCKSDGNYTEFNLINGKSLLVSTPIKKYEELLSDYDFFRVHKSHLINLKHVKTFYKNSAEVQMVNGFKIDVSRRKKDLFLQKVNEI